MTIHTGRAQATFPLKTALLAGFCGGVAEVLWISIYGSLAMLDAAEVARQVTATVFPTAAALAWVPLCGVMIHLLLSLVLGLVLTGLVWIPVAEHFGVGSARFSVVAALVVVWAFNFLIVLPVLNPHFVALVPLGVAFVSKLLFGIAMAAALQTTAGEFENKTAALHAA